MKDVYNVYGKDSGYINTKFKEFYSEAYDFLEFFSDNNIIRVGNILSQKLFVKLLDDLEQLKSNVNDYTKKKRDTYASIEARENEEYQNYIKEQAANEPCSNVYL